MHWRRKQGAAYWGGEHVNPSVDVVQASSNLAWCWYPIISRGHLISIESDEQMAAMASTSCSWLWPMLIRSIAWVDTYPDTSVLSFLVRLDGAYATSCTKVFGIWAPFPKRKRGLTLFSQRLVGIQSEIRDQRSNIQYPDITTHQPSAISNQVIDLDRMSDDRCIVASLPLAMHTSQLLLPALWVGDLIAIAKCRAHCYFEKVVKQAVSSSEFETNTPVLERYQIRRSA